MPNVVVFGAGMVARPLVRYLLEQPDYTVTVATRTVSKAERIIDNHPKGVAKPLNVKDMGNVEEEVKVSKKKNRGTLCFCGNILSISVIFKS